MQKVSWFFKISAVALLAIIVAAASLAGGFSGNALAATAAATKPAFELCKAPTPTPTSKPTNTPKGATAVPTAAATAVMTQAPTIAATAAPTMAATTAPTAVATQPPPTVVPPTATTIPVGKKPANAGLVARFIPGGAMLRGGNACVQVLTVTAGGPAAIGGIKKGDLILGVDKAKINTPTDFFNEVAKHVSGDKITVYVQRGADEIAADVTLGLNPFSK